ncbi:MAG: YkgJ family cysteine cluster protein [Planctomycetaceae bacterium]
MANAPWYREGLAFECTGCGDCCSGAPGFVWVDDAEIAALAMEMAMPIDDFERKFVRQVGIERSLVEYPDGDCIFLDPQSRKCTVYAARPTQCRTWPFWSSNLRSREDWKQACDVCPGSGNGRLYSFSEIEVRRTAKDV